MTKKVFLGGSQTESFLAQSKLKITKESPVKCGPRIKAQELY